MDIKTWCLLIVIVLMVVYVAYQQWFRREKMPRDPYWEITFLTTDGKPTVRVSETIYQEIKVWLRGEGDNLYEITSDDGYLGLRRAHVVCATGKRK